MEGSFNHFVVLQRKHQLFLQISREKKKLLPTVKSCIFLQCKFDNRLSLLIIFANKQTISFKKYKFNECGFLTMFYAGVTVSRII